MSLGINDPFYRNDLIEWLGKAVTNTINCSARSAKLPDQNEAVHFFMPIFGQLKPYAVNDISASLYMAKVIVSILSCSTNALHEKILGQ